MRQIGLFSGIGGFELAARWMGWNTVAWCEWDAHCQKALRYHFPKAIGHGDITKTDFTPYANKIDILTGGFPCQPYSIAGTRKGTDDTRHLWPEMLRAIREIKPAWVVGENVRGLINWSGGLVFDEIQSQLEAEGYQVSSYLLPASAVGAPHERYRLWIVARNEKCTTDTTVVNDSKHIGEKEGRSSRESRNGIIENTIADTTSVGWSQRDKGTKAGYATQDIPDWRSFPTQSPVCTGNDGISSQLDGITFPYWRRETIKAFGNAIVPQEALVIYKAIEGFLNH